MKILVIWRVKEDADSAAIQRLLVDEERFAWRSYLGGLLREHYESDAPAPAISVVEANSVEAAKAALADLPLLKAGLIEGEYFPLRPFKNWDTLFREEEVIEAPPRRS